MTYLQIVRIIGTIARQQRNVNTVVREFLDLNRETTRYSAVVIQDREGLRDFIQDQEYITYSWHIGYVDRLIEDQGEAYDVGNRDSIYAEGIRIINSIINIMRDSYDLDVFVEDRIHTFDQRFTALCAGVYMAVDVRVPLADAGCVDGIQDDLFDTLNLTYTSNGQYQSRQTGLPWDEVNVSVDVHPTEELVVSYESNGYYKLFGEWKDATISVSVPEEKEERTLNWNITENQDVTLTPTGDYVWNEVHLVADVHPSQRLTRTYTTNGSKPLEGEWKDGTITVNVHPSTSLSARYTENGTYTIAEEFNGGEIDVDVHPSTSLSVSYSSNGTYNLTGEWKDATISVSVSEGKPEETLVQSISVNGSYSFLPTPGSVFSDASIAVDVHPSTSLSVSYSGNGVYPIQGEFNGGQVTVSVPDYYTETVEYLFDNCGSVPKIFYYDAQDGGDYTDIIAALPSGWTASPIGGSGDTNIIYYTSSDNQIVTPYDSSAFGNASIVSNTYNNGVGTIIFNNPVTIIDSVAFENCSTLTSIVIPSTVRKIEFCSFWNCIGLTSIYIPANIDNISTPFIGCYNLTSIVVDPDNENYDSRNNCNAIIWDDDVFHQRYLEQGCANTVIPSTVVVIGENSFNGMITLTSITIPSSVTDIRSTAFKNTGLTSITIPSSVTNIGQDVFRDCTNLTEVIVNATTPPTTISPWNAFNNNASGRLIKVPAASLQDYLTAPGWSDYAADIVAQ